VKVVDATGEVTFKFTRDPVNSAFVIKPINTHEDVGERGGCEGEGNDGFVEHSFSTAKKERY